MAAQRIRHAKSVREAEQMRDEFITLGYKVESSGENTTIVKKTSWGSVSGHLLVALFTVWWTLGLGNLAYALIAHKSDEVLIKTDEEALTTS
jgi:hypothetical protein